MTKLPVNLRLDDQFEGDIEKVQEIIDDTYRKMAPIINDKPDIIILDRDPTANDNESDLGTLFLNSSSGAKYMLTALPSTWTAF